MRPWTALRHPHRRTGGSDGLRQSRGHLQVSGPGGTRLASLKSIDLDLHPIHHHTQTRVRAHVFISMLAAYLVWQLRQAWAPLTFTDESRPARSTPSHPPDAPKPPTPRQQPRPPPRTARPQPHRAARTPRHVDSQPSTRRRPRRVRLRPARNTTPHPTPKRRNPRSAGFHASHHT